MTTYDRTYLLHMLKALADESRLTLLNLLNDGELTVGDLAQRVELSEPTVSHHLSKLRGIGFVSLRMAGNQRFYSINRSKLGDFKHMAAQIERLAAVPQREVSDNGWIDALDWDEADKQVLRDYTINGRLRNLPVKKQKKTLVVLRWVATLFEPDRMYTEPEVNAVLKTVYEPDFVSLRRDLIDFGYLRRELGGGKYWRTPADENVER
ncbi:MAG: metalloregulator ArsR/SmtB family transcription factor [Anaerolineae bacterium]|nr:metalloregulator ArsR/SmtB family transcription factor [Anaerolineae bacterium]